MARYAANPLLRQARAVAGLSQDEFAERLGEFMRARFKCNVSPAGNLVGMWERGEARPGHLYRRGTAAFTGLDEAALGFGPQFAPAPPALALTEEEDDTNRRECSAGWRPPAWPCPDSGCPRQATSRAGSAPSTSRNYAA